MPGETTPKIPRDAKLSTSDFTEHPELKECLKRLHDEFDMGAGGSVNTPGGTEAQQKKRPFIVSDTLDGEGHQYVNLVQKGGGVLGVALVGYTYILETMGIRFLRLAGTSAGAINTALMTVIGDKTTAKSTDILKSICDLDFFNLVDGHPAARWLIKKFITHKDFTTKVKNWITVMIAIMLGLLAGDFIFFSLEDHYASLSIVTKLFFVLTGFYTLLIAFIIYYVIMLLKRLKNSGFGINPGDYFYDWIKKQLSNNGVNKVSDLNKKASQDIPGLCLRVENEEPVTSLKGDVTFITSELVTQNKIQFPAMCRLFSEEKNIDESLQPAGFIRASMSIPVFFESYMITDIPCEKQEIKDAWLEVFGEKDPPSTARFVDGGILSNFPINIFYNPKVIIPRLPSFGIDLDDTKPNEKTKRPSNWSLLGYAGRMFNTIRFYYDKDFLLKNKVFEKGIGKVPLSEYNWLNFFLKPEDKINMFMAGAKAATDFLIGFDWKAYKDNREFMQRTFNKK